MRHILACRRVMAATAVLPSVVIVFVVACVFAVCAAEAVELEHRVLYNDDGDTSMYLAANGDIPAPIGVEDLRARIDEIAYEGSDVTTMLLCINAQVMYYPTTVGTMRGTLSTPAQRASWPAGEIQRFENINNFYNAGIDPHAVMLAEAKQQGLEALLTFRMNDAHGNEFLKTQFWYDHPEYRLGEGLDFWHTEVRDYVFDLVEEAVQRYDCDGIELDFNRFPTFFDTGTTTERIAKINSLVGQVRNMLDVEGANRGKHLVLTARVPSNYGSTPPTYATSRAIGCDPVAWVENGWIDYLTVSEWLHESGDLPIESWKSIITEVPVYGGIECATGGAGSYLTANQYRVAAQNLWEKGADGVYLFNFFTPWAQGLIPHFEVLADMGPMPGDANGDGAVDAADAAVLAANWQTTSATWAMGDFNGDDKVDDSDATILAVNWQAGVAGVPEPSAMVLLLGMLAVFFRYVRVSGFVSLDN